MTKRLIHTATHDDKQAKVYFDPEWEDYEVYFYAAGVHMDNSDYFTADRADAIATADLAVKDEREWNEANNLSQA